MCPPFISNKAPLLDDRVFMDLLQKWDGKKNNKLTGQHKIMDGSNWVFNHSLLTFTNLNP